MKVFLTDPVVLICGVIIIFGIVGLFWGIGKFRRMKSPVPETNPTDELLPAAPDLRDIDFRAPAMAVPVTKPASPAVGKDVADRLESMTLRLAEMQSVLMKQSTGAAGQAQSGAAAGGVGQGFSPETIDKLLKIIGNVIQQVDILQKNLNLPKETPAANADSTTSPLTRI
jgi:hypothetical protein